ncbi:hypothetical protein BJ741DRAFT_620031 [Chytriomyces cf. hyalinus JEL632]|nr:hypothetical protein BJ741DRAFT_620031 [Chytriomyces cf. hyalinus JEL632]
MRISQLLAEGTESVDGVGSAESLGSIDAGSTKQANERALNITTDRDEPKNVGSSAAVSEKPQRDDQQQQQQWGFHLSQMTHITHLTHVPMGYQLMLVPTEAFNQLHSNKATTSNISNPRSAPSNSHVCFAVPHHVTTFNPLSRHLLPSPAGSESSDTNCNLDTLADLALVGPAVDKAAKKGVTKRNGAPQKSNRRNQVQGFNATHLHENSRQQARHQPQSQQQPQPQQHACPQSQPQSSSDSNLITPKDIFLAPTNSSRRRSIASNQEEQSNCDEDPPANESSKKRKTSDSSIISVPPLSNSSRRPHAISTTEESLQDLGSGVLPSPTEAPTSKELERRYVCPHYGQPKAKRLKYGDLSRGMPDPEDLICHAKFRRRQEMERHLASVHGSEEDKGWVCPGPVGGKGCGKRYARADALRKHLVSSRSRNLADGCSYGLNEDGIVAMVKRGAASKRL